MSVHIPAERRVDVWRRPDQSRRQPEWWDRLVESLRRRALLAQFSADQATVISRSIGGRC